MELTYFTIGQATIWEQKIERSRFIGQAAPVVDIGEAQAFVNRIKTEVHPQATHNCFAYRIGLGENPLNYYSDQGEPSGTAGRPILNALLQQDLTNTVVVVTRYFGGKKLGIRGLIDAYHSTALQTLIAAGRHRFQRLFTISLELPYAQSSLVQHLLQTYEGKVVKEEYGATVHLEAQAPEAHQEALTQALSGLPAVKWRVTK
jgi:uncharacterized YigZ family protein